MQQQSKITVIFGPNGSGKTQYVERMRREMASDRVRYVAFSDAYGAATDRAYYLQLRWNQHDIDAETPCTGELLEKAYNLAGEDTPERRELKKQLYALFHMEDLLDKYIISLSSGELRKFQLIKTLLADPKVLILDNPFIGLDAETRQQLNSLLRLLAHERSIELYLVLSRSDDMPDYADEVIRMEKSTDNGEQPAATTDETHLTTLLNEAIAATPSAPSSVCCVANATPSPLPPQPVIDMHNVSIRYGERTILRSLDWLVCRGEHWALGGQNGSGKSTLLSLVCADNPQSYACDISLFGNKRGSGETIWEIKKRIGYVSPEIHRSYMRNLPTINVVASGLKDTVGLYVRPTEKEKVQCLAWMRLFGIENLAERSFMQLSSGEQRLALVCRAFVKNPELLILDEPLHGLDDNNRQLVRSVIDLYCKLQPEATLIMVTHYEEELPTCIDHHIKLQRN